MVLKISCVKYRQMENVIKDSESVINATTGEIIDRNQTTNISVGNEPQYFKIYTDAIGDISNLCNLRDYEKNIFIGLAKNMSFTNTVILVKPIKRLLMKETGITSLNTLNKGITNLHKKGFLIREERGVYKVNPMLAGKGKWENIKALRMTIEYSSEGRSVEIAKITKGSIQLKEVNSVIASSNIETFKNEEEVTSEPIQLTFDDDRKAQEEIN